MAPTSVAMIACDSVSDPGPQTDASTSTTDADAASPLDAPADVLTDAASCFITATYFDSGIYYDGGDGAIDVGCIYNLPCGLPPTLMSLGCGVYFSDTVDSSLPDAHAFAGCNIAEGSGCTAGSFTPGDNGSVGIICADCLGGGGRRPRGLARLQRVTARTPVGRYFAQMAHEESASVHAFHRMKQELLRFGAPASLVLAAARAEQEEIRHAALMRNHARAFGGMGVPARTKKARRRSLEAMAIENVVEGCVNETFGALLMTWQAQHASSESLRAVFSKIANDEIGHAALSHSVAAWADSQLDARAQIRVKRARARAVAKLQRSRSAYENAAFDDRLAAQIGWPTPTQRSELVQKMLSSLALV
ncbi:MAG: ferritin-like domain-containing protein [Polyangiaceae bacterium]